MSTIYKSPRSNNNVTQTGFSWSLSVIYVTKAPQVSRFPLFSILYIKYRPIDAIVLDGDTTLITVQLIISFVTFLTLSLLKAIRDVPNVLEIFSEVSLVPRSFSLVLL